MPNAYLNASRMLNRVPDDVILAVATQDMHMGSPRSCLVATVVKEALSGLTGKRIKPDVRFYREHITAAINKATPDKPPLVWYNAPEAAQRLYGGSFASWHALYGNADDGETFPAVERAFVNRVNLAVTRSR